MVDQQMWSQLAYEGAKVLVTAMTSDLWQQVRARVAKLFGRGQPDREAQAGQRLDVAATELTSAPGGEVNRRAVAAIGFWQGRLEALVEEHPELAAELRALVDEFQPRVGDTITIQVDVRDHGTANTVGKGVQVVYPRPGEPDG